MDPCPECGNHALTARHSDGLVLHECDLCGHVVGDPRATAQVAQAQQARAHGVDPRAWPLVALLQSLPGLRVPPGRGDDAPGALPLVRWQVLDGRGLVQLENLAKSLQLARTRLHLPWRLGVDYDRELRFVLQPDVRGPVDADQSTQAWLDLQLLGQCIARDSRLSWWARPR